ncbi:MAG: transposase [Pseudonocardiaceae bacterium]
MAGQVLAPVAGLSSTTAAGLARRFTDAQWHAVETGIGDIHTAMLAALAPQRAAALCETVTIDLDTTDVEVYGRHKRGVAYNYQGQRCGRPHVATWAETATALAADLLPATRTPGGHAADLLHRALAALAAPARAGRVLLRADAGYFAGPRRVAGRRGVCPRRQAHRPAVADPGRCRRVRVDRRDRHGRRAGCSGRLLPRLVAHSHPVADPPGPPGPRAGQRRPAVATTPHLAPRATRAADC